MRQTDGGIDLRQRGDAALDLRLRDGGHVDLRDAIADRRADRPATAPAPAPAPFRPAPLSEDPELAEAEAATQTRAIVAARDAAAAALRAACHLDVAATVTVPSRGGAAGVVPFDVPSSQAAAFAAAGFPARHSPSRAVSSFESRTPEHRRVLGAAQREGRVSSPPVVLRQEAFDDGTSSFVALGDGAEAVARAVGVASAPLGRGQTLLHCGGDPISLLPVLRLLEAPLRGRVLHAVGPGCSYVAFAEERPRAAPWVAHAPGRGCLVARDDREGRAASLFSRAGFRRSASGLWTATSPSSALAVADLLDPALRDLVRDLYRRWPFSFGRLDMASVADLASEEPPTGAGAAAKPDEGRESTGELRYDPGTGLFFSTDPRFARRVGLPEVREAEEPTWGTRGTAEALALRADADDDAEAELLCRLLEEVPRQAHDETLPPPFVPGDTPDPHQVLGIRHAMSTAVASLADDMGVGKTHMGAGVCVSVRERHPTRNPACLVVCPAAQRDNWTRVLCRAPSEPIEVRRLEEPEYPDAPSHLRRVRRGEDPVVDAASGGFVLVVSFEGATLDERVRLREWDVVVFDEAQAVKNQAAQRTQALVEAAATGGVVPLVARRQVRMTGTEVTAMATDLWPLVAQALLTAFGVDGMVDGPMGCCSTRRFRRIFTTSGSVLKDQVRNRRMHRLAEAIDAKIRLRRLKSDVMDLPPKVRHPPVVLPVTNAEILATAKREGELTRSLVGMSALDKARTRREIDSLRKLTGRAKVPLVVPDAIAKVRARARPMLLFTYHTELADLLHEEFLRHGQSSIIAHGKNANARERQRRVDLFQAGQADFFVSTLDACGVGYQIVRAKMVGIVELDHRAYKVDQAEDRTHRRGQDEPVDVFYYVVADSYDCVTAESMLEKGVISDILSGDDRRRLVQAGGAA